MAKKKDLGRYRSGLEKYCGDTLDAEGFTYLYEPKYVIVEGFDYPSTYYKSVPKKELMVDKTASKQLPITYKPDFVLPHNSVIIETKGFVRRNDSFPLRWKLFMRYLMKEDMSHFRLFIPRNQKQVDQIINLLKNESKETK